MRYTTKKKIWQDLLDANEENKSSKEQAICHNDLLKENLTFLSKPHKMGMSPENKN